MTWSRGGGEEVLSRGGEGGVVTWSRGEGGVVTWSAGGGREGGRCCPEGKGGVVTWSQGGRCCDLVLVNTSPHSVTE